MTESANGPQDGRPPRRPHDDEWLQGVLDALHRAAKHAHLLAHQTGTGVAYARDGKFGVYKPDPAMYEDLIPPPFEDEHELPEDEHELPIAASEPVKLD